MSAGTPLFYRHEKHPKTQPRVMEFNFQITGAKTVQPIPQGAGVFAFFDAVTQAQIDAYLSNDDRAVTVLNGFSAAKFDATAMGTGAFGLIVNMQGQANQVISAEVTYRSGTGLGTVVSTAALGSAGLTDSTLETAVGISPLGDIGLKTSFTGLDAATSGLITVLIKWISK